VKVGVEALRWVTMGGATFSADLGGSSKYSSVIFRLKAEVEKGSMSTSIEHGLVGPKRPGETCWLC